MYPFVLAVPWGMINKVETTDTRKPTSNCVPRLLAFVLSNKSTYQSIRSWHVILLTDAVLVAKLVETENTGHIGTFRIGSEHAMNRCGGSLSKRWREQLSEVFPMTNTKRSNPL